MEIGGRTCAMDRHGFARRMEFTPVDQGEDFIALELRDTGETLARYPFPFILRVTHRLLDDGFSTAFTVENTGTAPMPFCIGGHTAIRCPLAPGERFEDYELLFDVPEQAGSHLLSPEGVILHGRMEPMLTESGNPRNPPVIDENTRSTSGCGSTSHSMQIKNSSPPTRATTSSSRTLARSRRARWHSTSSPNRCP